MKAIFLGSAVVVATGCMQLLLPTHKTSYQIPVTQDGGQLVAYKVTGSVGDDQAGKAGIRVVSPSLDELRTWERAVELASYSDERVCFRWTDYQGTGDEWGDGQATQNTPADYTKTQMLLDTPSGKHYVGGVPTVDATPLSFQYMSYATDNDLPPRWIPAVSHFERDIVEECFTTDAPLADEASARWTIKGSRWEVSFDFAFGGSGPVGPKTATASRPPEVRVPPPKPAPAHPVSFIGRWGGDVAVTLVEGKHTDEVNAHVTLAIADAGDDMIELAFEGGQFDCPIRATVTDRRATIAGGQVCKVARGKNTFTLKTLATEMALSDTGLALAIVLKSTKASGGSKEKGMISMSGELAAL